MPVRRSTPSTSSGFAHAPSPIDAPWLRVLLRHAVRCSLASSLTLGACADANKNSDPQPVHAKIGSPVAPVADASQTVANTPAATSPMRMMPDGGARDAATPPARSMLDGGGRDRGGRDAGGLALMATCDAPDQWHLASGFELALDVDYVADRWNGTQQGVLSERGEACSGAKDLAACRSALSLPANNIGRHLLTTQGDQVKLWPHPAALSLLGDIDTPEEAIWLLAATGHDVACDALITRVEDQFRIAAKRQESVNCSTSATVSAEEWVAPDGTITEMETDRMTVQSNTCVMNGRRPEGLRSAHRERTASLLGEHFAAMAHMEAASVPAFAAIAGELRAYRAPEALVQAAERARHDEIRHARVTARLARRYGARALVPLVAHMPLRSLEAFALDNAVEGCVNETYAAATVAYRAVHASDPIVRCALAGIAEDETRHAELSWAIAAWVMPLLDPTARGRVLSAQRAAVAALADECRAHVAPDLCTRGGVPDARAAVALHASLTHTLWRA